MKLPSRWGLGQSDIHASLLLTLSLISAMLVGLSFRHPSYYEFHMAAISLPIVWTISLAVRIAAQQLSVGVYSHELSTVVGPTGNLSTDYEFLPPSRIMAYALSGQLATCGLLLLGATVNAATLQTVDGRFALPQLLDFVSGWSSRAWASQIMWVNAFIGLVNLLPTIPFDMRAACFALFSRRQKHVQEPTVFRRLASLDSHVAAVMMGIAATAVVMSLIYRYEFVAWYAAAAAAVYLFVASRWEASRAVDMEEQYAPIAPRVVHRSGQPVSSTGYVVGAEPHPERTDEPAGELEMLDEMVLPSMDIDEILRKIHREGADSLSLVEQEALLIASRELQQKREKQ